MHDYGYLVALDEYRAALLAACIGYQACSGVAALQERGLLVVDIKPNNLLISCWGGPEGLSELTVKVGKLLCTRVQPMHTGKDETMPRVDRHASSHA